LSAAVPALAQQQRVLGIDISYYQGNISAANWTTLHRPTDQQVGGVFGDGRDFVLIRASRGGTTGYYNQSDPSNANGLNTLSQRYDDPYFVQNITRATTEGLLAGSYHFSRPDIVASTQNSGGVANSGADEADHFIQMAGAWMRPGYLLPVHDFEAGDGVRTDDAMAQFCIDFSDRIYAVMGIRPVIYVNGNYAANILGGAALALRNQVVAGYSLWSARWPNQADPSAIDVQNGQPKDTYTPIYGPWDDAPNPTHPWKFWQYASTARLNGYNNGNSNIDVDVAQGGIEFVKDSLVPALWVTNSDGQWTTMSNWNSGVTPVAPVQGPGQMARVGSLTLPATRLPGSDDTVILDRLSANITVTLASGTHNIRKLYVRETLNITGGSLAVGYVPSWDSTTIAAQFSAPVTLSGSGSLSLHTLQVDTAQTFTLGGGSLTFNTINLMPHSTTPAKIVVTGDVSFSGLSSTSATIANGAGSGSSGLVDLGGGTRIFTVANVVSGVDMAVNVPITNGALTKTDAGTMSLAAANTYSGGTTVLAGRIELDGSLNSGVSVSGGVLAFGTATGIRTANGNLAVNAGGTLRIRLNGTTAGTQYDQLRLINAASTVTLAGTLDLIAAPSLASGSIFRILDISPSTAAVTGNFAGLPQNAEFYEDGQWWRISYTGGTGNDVVLTRITPTPWQTWQLTQFPTAVNNPAVAGYFVDFDKDSLVNLSEYALGGNPTVAAQTPLPQVSVLGGKLALTFTRTVANTDITITVQGTDNLAGPWTDLAASVNGAAMASLLGGGVTITETGTGATRSVEIRDLYLTTDPVHPRRFMRVQVTKP
jgi:autotransporter-associated beta strand protein